MKNIFTFLQKNSKYIRLVLFIAYCLFILCYTVLCREKGYMHKADLRFMWAYREMLTGHPEWKEDVFQNIANILFFVPFGALFPKVKSGSQSTKSLNRWQLVLIVGVLFSIFIEITQYITCRGLCELDDVVCNGLGALIGYWLYISIKKSMERSKKQDYGEIK